jgi:hypothetical protein
LKAVRQFRLFRLELSDRFGDSHIVGQAVFLQSGSRILKLLAQLH